MTSITVIARAHGFVALLTATAVLGACNLGPDGSKCGGAQSAFGRAILPDTGLAEGATVQIGLVQHDPYLIGEESEIDLQTFKSFQGLEPRDVSIHFRVVLDDGFVALDTVVARRSGTVAWGWNAHTITRSAAVRTRMYEAIRDNKVTVELGPGSGTAFTSRVRPLLVQANVSPIARCV